MATRARLSYSGSSASTSRAGGVPRNTAMRNLRWVSVWSWTATGSRSSSPTPSAVATSIARAPCGSSHSPPNRPSGRRRASTSSPPRSSHSASRASSGSSCARLRGAVTGSSSTRSSRCATHAALTGQRSHCGLVGVHSVAPSSITAWLSSPGSAVAGSLATSAAAWRSIAARPAVDLTSAATPWMRASTRTALPSTAATRSPNAIDAIAPDVYAPMPGTARSSAARLGNARPASAFAPAWRLRARE